MMCDVPLLLHLDCRLSAGEDKPLCMHDSNAMVEVVANDLQISFQHVCPVSLELFGLHGNEHEAKQVSASKIVTNI